MQIELTGLQECIAKLQKTRADLAGPEMDKALRKGGRVIREAMKSAAPVLKKSTPGSNALPPGALKAGIRVYTKRDEKPTEVLIGPNAKTSHVARWVEYGHRSVSGGYLKMLGNGKTRGTGKAGADVPAYPFLRPAFESSLAAAETAIVESLSESLKEQA